MENKSYVIRGGVEGRERLRILARVMRPTTLGLLNKVDVANGVRCLDVGCGGGDVSLDLAELVGETGQVIGIDVDEVKLDLARAEAKEKQLTNVEFVLCDLLTTDGAKEYDIVYARFLLTHLKTPAEMIARMFQLLKPGGMVLVEDIDCSGHFCYPPSSAFSRYVELYSKVSSRRGADPDIGRKLPGMLIDSGFEQVRMNVVQPAGLDGEVKLIASITLDNIADSLLSEGLIAQNELQELAAELHKFADDPATLMSVPRIVQSWASRPLIC